MVIFTRFNKKCRVAYLRVGIIAIALSALFIPQIEPVKSVGDNIFTLYVNDVEIGKVDDSDQADRLLSAARRKVAGSSADILLIEAESRLDGEEVLVGQADNEDEMLQKIIEVYEGSVKETMHRAYTVKIDDYMVNVSSAEAAVELLEASISKYAGEGKFSVSLQYDDSRALPIFTPIINKLEEEEEDTETVVASDFLGSEGFYHDFESIFDNLTEAEESRSFDDYDYGITDVSFADSVEVVESYIPKSQILILTRAIDEVTKDKEEKTIYEVVSGDTLSGISLKTGISVDEIISLNENLTSDSSVIHIGDELVVTVPQPELSVNREEIVYYEGTYEAPVEYVYNDSWYTTNQVVLQDPSSGFHKAVQKVSYYNNDVVSTEVVMEEVVAEAIPKIIEKGTKIPPTYIKPISGGRITDYFGYRTPTFKGMLAYHKAVDWGTPTGTAVMASCGGTVISAGWMSSYGYCIFIKHPGGYETRYAHLKKGGVLVSVGQQVAQGQKIGLSGNTGDSSGPHLHFEVRINGVAVDPLKVISQ